MAVGPLGTRVEMRACRVLPYVVRDELVAGLLKIGRHAGAHGAQFPELCGISADERAIEVDHITPRKHGGDDDLTNLQMLCYKCNANKGARDNTDVKSEKDDKRQRRDASSASCRKIASSDQTCSPWLFGTGIP